MLAEGRDWRWAGRGCEDTGGRLRRRAGRREAEGRARARRRTQAPIGITWREWGGGRAAEAVGTTREEGGRTGSSFGAWDGEGQAVG